MTYILLGLLKEIKRRTNYLKNKLEMKDQRKTKFYLGL